jgi:hypothetical protein
MDRPFTVYFPSAIACIVGQNRVVAVGDRLKAVPDATGLYHVYFDHEDEPIAHLTGRDVNKLANQHLVQE